MLDPILNFMEIVGEVNLLDGNEHEVVDLDSLIDEGVAKVLVKEGIVSSLFNLTEQLVMDESDLGVVYVVAKTIIIKSTLILHYYDMVPMDVANHVVNRQTGPIHKTTFSAHTFFAIWA